VLVSIADGTGYYLKSQSIGSIDCQRPTAPVVQENRGIDVVLSSTSVDVTGYYIFKDAIPEENTATSSNLITKVLAANATSLNLCGASESFAYGNNYTLRAIALDGLTGELGFGNASDQTEFDFTPTLKGARLLTHTQGAGTQPSASVGDVYDDQCILQGNATSNAGVSIKSVQTGGVTKLAFIPDENKSFNTDIPLTIYVGLGSVAYAEIKYIPIYRGQTFYIELGGKAYSGVFPSDDKSNGNTRSPLDVSNTPLNGQSL
jgi:hypothetical protein